MSKAQDIAIIILTYNRFEEFKLALDSALKQQDVNFHIFVFDNCSIKPLLQFVRNNPQITYIRHKKNIGFAQNFKFATNYVKKRGFKFSFLLGDDDVIAYPTAISDLFNLIKKGKNIHVVRGGYSVFVDALPKFTGITTYNTGEINNFKNKTEVDKALDLHITSYPGILFRNDLFQPYFSPYDDLVTPLIAPLIKILILKKFDFLPNKITMHIKTDHDQLATAVYNETVSNQDALEKSYMLIGKQYKRKISLIELINYKIYSKNNSNIKKYYDECRSLRKGIKAFSYIVAYNTPSNLLKIIKEFFNNIRNRTVKKKLKKHYPYLDKSYL
ncbi:MAG: glycosyltransferase family 2 protein [Candidatus Levybacteria bacterium]|nr:glycosyltransferase family 2 protein [Candidatus Levybacteria bacterium]